MELYIFIGSLSFWILYYYFEGTHDGAFALETRLLKNAAGPERFREIEYEFIRFERRWHVFDGLEKSLVKIVFGLFIYLLTSNFLFSFQMILLSVGIRSVAHDLFVALEMGKRLDHIGPDFLWWDKFLRKMHGRGINQYVIKLVPLAVLLLWIALTI